MTHARRRIRSGMQKSFLAVIVALVVVSAFAGYFMYFRPGGGGGETTTTQSNSPISTSTNAPGTPATTTTTTQGSSGREKKVLRVGIGIDADTLFPISGTTTTVYNIMRLMYEPLFRVDENGKIRPLLAESYNVSKDGLVYTVKLRKGIRFQDGTPFNATAVKFTFDKIMDPKMVCPSRADFAALKEVRVVDEYTVQFVLKYPYAPFLTVLAGGTASIISPTSFKKLGDKVFTTPYGLGTGPYEFEKWVRGQKIVLKKNPDYWGKKAYFDEVVFYVVPDPQTREAKRLSGELDMILQPPSADIQRLEKTKHVVVQKVLSTRVMFIGINTQWGPLKDKRVRQALNYAVDKNALIKDVLFGLAGPMDSVLPNFALGHVKLPPYSYNPEKAKELLKEAGYPNGFKVTIYTPVGRYLFDKEVAQAIGQYLRNIGLQVEVRPVADWPTYVHMLLAPKNQTKLELFLVGWAPSVPDPHNYLYQRFHSSQMPPHGFNFVFYNNSEVDKLLDEGVRETDPAVRAKIYENVSRILWDDAPNIYLYLQYFVVVHSDRLQGVKLLPYEMFDISDASFKS
ncbi:MAG: hypothetical protein J7L55_02000 [Desulfurococcales archaeon]|nr:hypothetical protein [Desulfurococcales archaeon]